MGLRATIELESLGLPETTPTLDIPVDYDAGMFVFESTFMDNIDNLTPVDTGRLVGSIECSTESMSIECVANCEYAQYVEYGTIYMAAQPYFEPSIAAALNAAMPEWQEAYQEAQEEEQEQLQQMQAGGTDGLNEMIGGLLGQLLGSIINAFLGLLGAILDDMFTIHHDFGNSYHAKHTGNSYDVYDIDIF
jgi:Bacteriophage HK97-gp10, putative tail-component